MIRAQALGSQQLSVTKAEADSLAQLRSNTGGDDEDFSEALSRIAWARLIEPGDRVAGATVAALGAPSALNMLISGASPKQLFSAVQSADNSALVTLGEIQAAVRRWELRLDRSATLHDAQHALACDAQLLHPGDAHWPSGLRDLGAHAPMALWVRGNAEALSQPSTAIVGARATTSYGEYVTSQYATLISKSGMTIISGGAYGIDAVAHRSALAAGAPTTAVLAGGIDRFYPAGHHQLLETITRHGVVCSEVSPGVAPTRWRFLQRNRLIAAIASATLVTEAGIRSGSINTAGHAAALGRPLGAVPGPITSATSHGCFRIIEEYDALMVTRDEHVAQLIDGAVSERIDHETSEPAPRRKLSVHARLIDAIPLRKPLSTHAIAKSAGIEEPQALVALTELDIEGVVRREIDPRTGEAAWRLVGRQKVH